MTHPVHCKATMRTAPHAATVSAMVHTLKCSASIVIRLVVIPLAGGARSPTPAATSGQKADESSRLREAEVREAELRHSLAAAQVMLVAIHCHHTTVHHDVKVHLK
jgi:hypothetical protein